ncbi:MAG: phytoene desaturase family protein [Candidatus Micrarchaeota archaeon]|nr:phytoene desaturase family protein [Candidatus Micrarchaeota archaeon]
MKVVIIGAGVGGMAAACRLAKLGFEVEIYEKNGNAGGRLACMQKENFRVDIGPTLLLMPWVLRKFFDDMGMRLEDWLHLEQLHPIYRIYFEGDGQFSPYSDVKKMIEEMANISQKDADAYGRYLADYKKYYQIALEEFIEKNFDSPLDMINPKAIAALLSAGALRDVYSKTGDYFADPRIRLAFSIQSVYIGAAPTALPAVYGLIPYVEFTEGVWYPKGGLYKIAEAIRQVCYQMGVKIKFGNPVKKIMIENMQAVGVMLEGGEIVRADAVISNADLIYTYLCLIEEKDRPHMPNSKLRLLKNSCSAFMIYLGIKGAVDLPHHTFLLPKDSLKTFEEIFEKKTMPQEPGIYIANPCVHDSSLAPEGHSILYILVPVPNLSSKINWDEEAGRLRRKVFERLERIGIKELEKRIVMEERITPQNWKEMFNLEDGATFGLSPTLLQSAGFRPPNKDRKIKRLYFVGASTHPGSGIPIVLLSAQLIEKRFKEEFFAGGNR